MADIAIEGDNPAMKLQFGSAVAVIKDNGDVSIKKTRDGSSWLTVDPELVQKLSDRFGITIATNPESIPVSCVIDGVSLPAGCGVIVGGANVGKTPVLRAIAEKLGPQAEFLRFGEPMPGYMTDEAEACAALVSHMLDPTIKVICVDSIKDLVASMDGAAMARGIPRVLFRMISQWGAIASALGKLVIFPLNISTDSAEAIKEVEAAVQSNATLSVFFSSYTGDTANFSAVARTGEGRLREKTVWKMSYPGGVPKLSIVSEGSPRVNQANQSDDASVSINNAKFLSQYVVNNAISRALLMTSKTEDQE